jgi:hypothetical protein
MNTVHPSCDIQSELRIKLEAEDKRKKEQKTAHDLLELIIRSTQNRKRKQIIIYLADGEKGCNTMDSTGRHRDF